jgi:hypothetical protein
MQYAPEPPFDSGTPETAPEAVLDGARKSVAAIPASASRPRGAWHSASVSSWQRRGRHGTELGRVLINERGRVQQMSAIGPNTDQGNVVSQVAD